MLIPNKIPEIEGTAPNLSDQTLEVLHNQVQRTNEAGTKVACLEHPSAWRFKQLQLGNTQDQESQLSSLCIWSPQTLPTQPLLFCLCDKGNWNHT